MTALLRQRSDLSRETLQWTQQQMDCAIPDCLVSGYEALESELRLPDPDDRHVLAAAIVCRAGTIVTYNLKDFPDAVLAPLGITAQHPDQSSNMHSTCIRPRSSRPWKITALPCAIRR